ncbi:hypothetical protein H0I23_15640 [Cellulophaga sp. HaHaR_3_176]|uniref:hypothetical protein n=1 Tax=Cellulophaga sp. HaHaR_3_176 TaxID=1942464 RepID=UPI001C1F9E23|nr:hypothetical protein [Cellulophaga sp. HaHaR_3_176]QWX83862.1 hypothetical protein H0I23_15640 [Cellulophaga sp. HaHaR_3_176]
MIGGASGQGMITSLRNNRKLLKSKRSFLNQKKEFLKAAEGKLELKKASKEELKLLRAEIYKERKRQDRINVTVWLSIVFALVLVTFFFANILSNHTFKLEKENLKVKTDNYLKLIEDGDQWLKAKNWNNAIFQYKEALEIFPNEYDINYRLTYALSLKCETDFMNCKEAKDNLDRLLIAYPQKRELFELQKILEYEQESQNFQ